MKGYLSIRETSYKWGVSERRVNQYVTEGRIPGVELTVNGAVCHGKSAAVNYSGRSQIASPLASFSIPNLSGTVQLSVVWHFNGSYSGVALGDIRVSGTAVV